LNRQSIEILRALRRNDRRGAMQKFLQHKTFINYHELLAKERSETEREFILKVLTRKGPKNAAAQFETSVGEGRAGNSG
jgi:hypothetical protein